ncbi:MAG: tetratricopeptide repeat protein [Ferruginibacter sp.]
MKVIQLLRRLVPPLGGGGGVVVLCFLITNCHAQDSLAFSIGGNNFAKQKFDDAIYWYSKSIEKKHKIAESYRYIGSSWLRLGDENAARKNLFHSLLLDSTAAKTFEEIGTFYLYQSILDSAVIWFTKAINKDPHVAYFYDNRGVTFIQLGELEKGIADEDMAISLEPNESVYVSNRGYGIQKQGKFEEAISVYQQALSMNPSMEANYTTYINIAFCHVKLEQYQTAMEECTKVLNRFRDNTYALTVRGMAFIGMSKKQEACGDFMSLYNLDKIQGQEYLDKYCK